MTRTRTSSGRWRAPLAVALAVGLLRCGPDSGLRHVEFSGERWHVKRYVSIPWGPGPNYFADDPGAVEVDGSGFLHLRIQQRDGRWSCAEVITDRSFGYGTYAFTLGSRPDLLDPNVVLGLFTWDEDTPDPGQVNRWREIDVEASRWGSPGNDDLQFVVQPWDLSGANMVRFQVSDPGDTTYAFTWTAQGVAFTASRGAVWPPAPSDVISSWSYAGPATPVPGHEQARMNLWLVNGTPPQDGHDTEVVVKSFHFVPPASSMVR